MNNCSGFRIPSQFPPVSGFPTKSVFAQTRPVACHFLPSCFHNASRTSLKNGHGSRLAMVHLRRLDGTAVAEEGVAKSAVSWMYPFAPSDIR